MKKHLLHNRNLWATLLILVGTAALYFLPAAPSLAPQMGTREVAQVRQVDDRDLKIQGPVTFGSQRLTVELCSGGDCAKKFFATNELRGQLELDQRFEVGDKIVVVRQNCDPPGGELVAANFYRRAGIIGLFALFGLLLGVFGSWVGVQALISFVFSCMVIWKVVIPLTLRGYPASWIIFGATAILTGVIIFLVAGFNRKGLAAFSGAMLGVISGLAMSHGFTALLKLNGATMPYAQALLFSACETLDLADIFVGAIILGASGAVMDLAVDIASGVAEIVRHNPALPRRELWCSGLRLGRQVVGTMTTTLLLAYSGSFLTLLMMFARQGNAWVEFLDNPLVAAEAVKTLIGSFSLVLVAPFTALTAALLLHQKPKNSPET